MLSLSSMVCCTRTALSQMQDSTGLLTLIEADNISQIHRELLHFCMYCMLLAVLTACQSTITGDLSASLCRCLCFSCLSLRLCPFLLFLCLCSLLLLSLATSAGSKPAARKNASASSNCKPKTVCSAVLPCCQGNSVWTEVRPHCIDNTACPCIKVMLMMVRTPCS